LACLTRLRPASILERSAISSSQPQAAGSRLCAGREDAETSPCGVGRPAGTVGRNYPIEG